MLRAHTIGESVLHLDSITVLINLAMLAKSTMKKIYHACAYHFIHWVCASELICFINKPTKSIYADTLIKVLPTCILYNITKMLIFTKGKWHIQVYTAVGSAEYNVIIKLHVTSLRCTRDTIMIRARKKL